MNNEPIIMSTHRDDPRQRLQWQAGKQRRSWRTFVIAAMILLLADTVTTAFAAGLPLVLSGINEREANGDAHAFELYGDFRDNTNIMPIVFCNGKLMQAEIIAPPESAPLLPTQINVNVEAMAAGSTCTFSLYRLTDSASSNALSVTTSAVPIQINGIVDRGVSNGRRFVELYGNFQDAPTLQARVICGGRYVGGHVEFASSGQINVSLPDAGPANGCSFVLRQPGSGLASPMLGTIPVGSGMVPAGFGGLFWGGVPTRAPSSLVVGQEYLNAAGFNSTRLIISPIVRNGNPYHNYYNFNLPALNAACPKTVPFLPCAIRRPEYQSAISAPSLRTIILTAYDSASSGSIGEFGKYVDPEFWNGKEHEANRDKVRREFRDLTYALYQTQHDTGKTFVLTSWEADNGAYCGGFYSYWTNSEVNLIDPSTGKKFKFRALCGNIASRNNAISAITEWFKVRREGILAGRQLAANAGYRGVTVSDGVEFNMNTLANRYDVDGTVLRSVLRHVIPVVKPDYVLYSSYDSQYRGRMEQDLRQIRDWLANNSRGSQLAIGEVGFPRHALDGIDMFRTVETVKAIQRVGLPFAILWEAFDTGAGDRVSPYGLLHANGRNRSVMHLVRRELQLQATEIASNPSARIVAANDLGIAQVNRVSYRFFELYGSFPNGPFGATALCDGVETPIDVVYESIGQINVRLRHEGLEERYCTLRLWRNDGTRSLAFGPVID